MKTRKFKFIKLNELSKKQIFELEERIETIIADMLDHYQKFFMQNGYILDMELERINEAAALKGSKEHRMRKDQCFEPYYYSFISLAVKDSSGKLVGNEDDGYLIENIHIWHVSKSLFSKKKGYIINLSPFEIKQEVETVIKDFMTVLNINI
ncbi:hypothetical protein [Anoxybacteroides tepidamans]|uniref:hypothetical protein n=1 Tax=Anoxybacteroides tepidamans TaxID=265948 RepID=UPI0004816D97|nr:hypothetical protein [Anoxybacillus tepidamans]